MHKLIAFPADRRKRGFGESELVDQRCEQRKGFNGRCISLVKRLFSLVYVAMCKNLSM